jgi:hypothetical protein
VSDHEIWPRLRSRPRPQKRSLTPRCPCLSRSRRTPRCDRRSPQWRAQSAPSLHRPSQPIVRFAVARSRRSALLRPRMRAADGLDRAIREPPEGNCRRPHVNLLTTRADSAIVEFSSTVAARNPLHIARCEALESAAPGHDSFLSRFTSWSLTRATTRPRRKQSERTALRPQARAIDPSTLQNRHRHAATARRLSVVDASAPHSVLPIHCRTSTRNRHRRSTWGRRIMAERRRHRRERRQQHRPHARTNGNNQVDAQCDGPLRAFVRALARQAAHELFEAQRTRHSAEIH